MTSLTAAAGPDPDRRRHPLDEIVVLADCRRRWRHAVQTITQVAPWASAMLVVAAVSGLVMTGSMQFAWWLWLAVTAGASIFALSARRGRPATDTMAARADADARLDGELQSGHWFARHVVGDVSADIDPWTQFHVARATARARTVAWDVVYPPVPGRQAAAVVTLCAVVMLALPLAGGPLQRLGRWVTDRASFRIASGASLTAAGVQRVLERLLGGTSRADAAGAVPAVDAATDDDRRWALDNAAARLTNRNAQDRVTLPPTSAPRSRLTKGESARVDLASRVEAAIDAAAGATGLGGVQNLETPTGRGEVQAEYSRDDPAESPLIAALSREVLVSKFDAADLGDATQDGRRRTQKGQSAIEFSGALARTTFDIDHVTAPAPVPEQRRSFLAHYFKRVIPSSGAEP